MGFFYISNTAGGPTTSGLKQRHKEDAFSATTRRVNELFLLNAGEPTPMLHLNSHHNTLTRKQLLFFHKEEGSGMFSIFLFFSTNSKYQNPPRGKMIRSDSTLNQLFPLCGHCFLFFAVKQAKQPVKRPEPVERMAIVCWWEVLSASFLSCYCSFSTRSVNTWQTSGWSHFKVYNTHSNSSVYSIRTGEV